MSELPKGWVDCKVGDLIKVKNGYAFRSTDYTKDGFPIIRISEINNSKIDLKNAVCTPKTKVNYDFLVIKGDLLMALSGATTGKVGVFNSDEIVFQNQRVGNFKIINEESLVKGFRNYFILSKRKEIELAAYGGAQPNISATELEQMNFPLAPFNEQKRIVEKLDKLLSKVDDAKTRLEKIPVILKRFRQSVLNAAVTGELTKDWREKNKDKVEIQIYYESIELERIHDYNDHVNKSKLLGLRRPRKPTNLDDKLTIENENLFGELPSQWQYVPLGKITSDEADSIVDGPFGSSINVKTDYLDSGIPVIRIANVRPFWYDSSNLRFIHPNKFENLKRHNVSPGDILLAKVGATIGDCCIYPPSEEIGMLSTTGSCRIRVDEKLYSKEFLCIVLNAYKYILKQIASEVAQPFLNMQAIKNLPVPLTCINEQKEIVKRVEALFKTADEIETRYKKAKAYVDKLTQSILAKAFRGELVPQDPNDPPASELLEKIKAEKELLNKSVVKGKRSRAGEPAEKLLERISVENKKEMKSRTK